MCAKGLIILLLIVNSACMNNHVKLVNYNDVIPEGKNFWDNGYVVVKNFDLYKIEIEKCKADFNQELELFEVYKNPKDEIVFLLFHVKWEDDNVIAYSLQNGALINKFYIAMN